LLAGGSVGAGEGVKETEAQRRAQPRTLLRESGRKSCFNRPKDLQRRTCSEGLQSTRLFPLR
jgi:hypothetical protein